MEKREAFIKAYIAWHDSLYRPTTYDDRERLWNFYCIARDAYLGFYEWRRVLEQDDEDPEA